jgi:hypothetical protein
VTTPTQLQIVFSGGLVGETKPVICMFASAEAAAEVFKTLTQAIAAYHNRANDREKTISFAVLGGEQMVDVSSIVSIGYEEALADDVRAALEEWSIGVEEIKAKGRAAGRVIAPELAVQS